MNQLKCSIVPPDLQFNRKLIGNNFLRTEAKLFRQGMATKTVQLSTVSTTGSHNAAGAVLHRSFLFHLGKSKFRTLTDTVRPALHHGFQAGVETHAFRAIDMMIAEQAALPAAKAVKCHRYR